MDEATCAPSTFSTPTNNHSECQALRIMALLTVLGAQVLTLLLLTMFATCITLLLIHYFNPDKEPLPWRAYCSVPPPSSAPPDLFTSMSSSISSYPVPATTGAMPPPFPPVSLDLLPPAGLLIGVFSMDSAFERRMLVRTTWATHPRSRDGAGEGDGGMGTSRTIVRFILGQPRKEWEARIRLELESECLYIPSMNMCLRPHSVQRHHRPSGTGKHEFWEIARVLFMGSDRWLGSSHLFQHHETCTCLIIFEPHCTTTSSGATRLLICSPGT